MSESNFNYEKEIKKLEKQIIKLSKNTREKFKQNYYLQRK